MVQTVVFGVLISSSSNIKSIDYIETHLKKDRVRIKLLDFIFVSCFH